MHFCHLFWFVILINRKSNSLNNLDEGYQRWFETLPNPPRKTTPAGQPTKLSVTVAFKQIESIREALSQAVIHIFLVIEYTDPRLGWSLSDLNSSCMYIDKSFIWTPPLQFIERQTLVEEVKQLSPSQQMYVCHQGRVAYLTDIRLTVMMKFEIDQFPFDYQTVRFMLGCPLDKGRDVEYENISAYMLSTISNPEWSVKRPLSCFRTRVNLEPNSFPIIACDITIQRLPLYYIINVAIPVVLTNILAIIAMYAPGNVRGEREHKFDVAITTMLSMGVLGLMLSSETPKTSETVPKLVKFFMILMCNTFGVALLSAVLMIAEMKMVVMKTGMNSFIMQKSQWEAAIRLIERISFALSVLLLVVSVVWFFWK